MKRGVTGLLAALAATLVVVTAAGAAEPRGPSLTLRETVNSAFPQKQYILGLPSNATLNQQNVTVLENGDQVNDLTIELPGAGTNTRVGTVLLIDASKSMEGEPIEKAIEAAQAFATRIPERVELAVVLFNNKTPIVLPLTKDPQRIANTLSRVPSLAYGTRIHDAVLTGASLLKQGGVDVASMVLLSDGADVGSVTEVSAALAEAKSAGARIFSVGLASPQFEPKTLATFANETGGAYALAKSTKDLTPIFRGLGARISSEYVLDYESFASAGERVYVSVRAAAFPGIATTSYAAPGLPSTVAVGDSWWDRVIQSPWLALLIGALVVGLFGWAVYYLVQQFDRRFEKRLAAFALPSPDDPVRLRTGGRREDDEDELVEDKGIAGLRWYKRLEENVRVARLGLSAGQIVTLTAIACAFTAVAAVVVTGLWWMSLLGALPILAARSYVDWKARTLRREFGEQLPETLDVVSSALRSGHSLVGALGVAVDGAPEPSRTELGRALADERLGVPLDMALRRTADRMKNPDLTQVSLVAQLQREAGTNSAEVLDQVATNVRHQIELRQLIRSLTAQGRLSRWIVSLLPVGLFFAMFSINKEYLSPLWETAGGTLAMIAAGIMIVIGSYAIKRIVEIDA